MGNCQAIDAAVLVIQHPSGREERLYWSISAGEVMKMNPGHYVSLIMPLPPISQELNPEVDQKSLRFTRVKLLRPTDTLVLGRAYRLITSQEVMKVLRAKKYAKTKRSQPDGTENSPPEKESPGSEVKARTSELNKPHQGTTPQETKRERHRQRMASTNSAVARPKSWRPSLQSISEATS